MDGPPTLHGPLARAYGAALHAVAVADGELQAIESARLDLLLERRCPGLDREDLFFERTTPEGFAASVRAHGGDDLTAIGLGFVADAVELATVDSELRAVEAHVILRVARALGLSRLDVGSVTRALDEWLGSLSAFGGIRVSGGASPPDTTRSVETVGMRPTSQRLACLHLDIEPPRRTTVPIELIEVAPRRLTRCTDAGAVVPALPAAETVALHEMSIMVVDDEPGAIQLIRHMLRDFTNVRFATSGADALRLIRSTPPDLLLLDGEMPGQSGFDVCSVVKADPRLREIAIVFVTAHDDVAFEARALTLGAADFIAKPLSSARINLRVKLHLELKRQLDTLRSIAATDGGTGLANRRHLHEVLASEWRRAQRTGAPLSFLMIDVDHFKGFNDAYGHPAGDHCLRTVAEVISSAVRREHDLAGRFGGEEFAVVLPHTDRDGALRVGRAVCEAMKRARVPHRASPTAAYVTVSVGAATVPGHALVAVHDEVLASDPGQPLIEAADRALYRAKGDGRNRVESEVVVP